MGTLIFNLIATTVLVVMVVFMRKEKKQYESYNAALNKRMEELRQAHNSRMEQINLGGSNHGTN